MQLVNEQQEILSLVSKFGCLDIEQIKILMEPFSEKMVIMLVNNMIKNHMLSLTNQRYVTIFGNQNSLQLSTIACIWAMMEMSSKADIKESMRAEPPAQIYFTANHKDAFEVMYVDTANIFKLNTLQERFKVRSLSKSSSLTNNCILLVISDENSRDLLVKIKDYDFIFPFGIAIVSTSSLGKPPIRFLKGTK